MIIFLLIAWYVIGFISMFVVLYNSIPSITIGDLVICALFGFTGLFSFLVVVIIYFIEWISDSGIWNKVVFRGKGNI